MKTRKFALAFSSLALVAVTGLAIPGTALAQETCTVGEWTSVAPLNTARSRLGVAYLESTGKFYAAGGEASGGNRAIPIEEYDPVANTWTDRAQLITGVSNTGTVGVGNFVYIPGGWTGSAQAEMQRFDPATNSVTTMAPMPQANLAHAVAALNGKIHVLGGSDAGIDGTTHYIYDIASDTWSSGAPVPTAVNYPAATTDGTLIYLLGGTPSNLDITQVYNPATNTWSAGTPMSTGRGGAAAFYDGANVWAVGGGWASYLNSTEYWNGSTWTTGPAMNTGARTSGAAYGAGIALKAGGWNGNYVNAAEKLSLECETPLPTCAEEGYTGAKLLWCQKICESDLEGAALDSWIHRWINRYRTLPACAAEEEEEEEQQPD